MSQPEICPICKNPKTASPGSLTQWIVACTCDLKTEDLAEEENYAINLCKTCGKRIGEGRSGSLTQFIFRSDTCQCKRPQPVMVGEDQNITRPLGRKEEFVAEDLGEQELKLDSLNFPTERYKPVKELGKGATGSVFLARDKLLNKRVAVKILNSLDPKTLVAFQDEAKKTSSLHHQYILDVLDFGATDQDTPYMVLEYFLGYSLEALIESNGPIGFEKARVIFANLADALSYAHKKEIFHRDLKPSNILIQNTDYAEVRLIDFGIAKVNKQSDETLEPNQKEEEFVGTPFYMCPDTGKGLNYDARSEVYSLTCVLYKALTGHPPFEGETILQTLAMHANDPPPVLLKHQIEGLPGELEDLIKKGLAKDPGDRFQTTEAFKEALLAIEFDVPKEKESTLESLAKPRIRETAQEKISVKSVALSSVAALASVSLLAYVFLAPKGQAPPEKKPVIAHPIPQAQSKLQEIELGHMDNLTNEDLALIVTNPNLQLLALPATTYDDSCIPILLKAKNLRTLVINETGITNKGLLKLTELKKLNRIKLTIGEGISEFGIKLFKQKNPGCQFQKAGNSGWF